MRIFKTYGADAIPLVSENPYRLARDISGIGFKSADQIAERLGISRTAMVRARAGIAYTLAEAMAQWPLRPGRRTSCLVQAEKLLEIPSAILAEALQAELATGAVVADTIDARRCIFLAYLWRAERFIAGAARGAYPRAATMARNRCRARLGWVEKKFGLMLAASQRAAVTLALASKVVVVTGGPGVGKTTLVNSILKILSAKSVAVALCAPTGRAAKRLAESTGLAAKTIHRLLEADPRKAVSNAVRPIRCSAICWWWMRSRWWTCR